MRSVPLRCWHLSVCLWLWVMCPLSLSAGTAQEQPREPGVRVFSPQGTVKQVNQVRVLFSDPMISFGDPLPQRSPFSMSCGLPGEGIWLDPLTWVLNFEGPVPAGVRCRFELEEGIRTRDGERLTGPRSFSFDTGGPAVLSVFPGPGSEYLDENQVFVLELDGPVLASSVRDHAYFVVEGIADAVEVDIVDGEDRTEILKTLYQFSGRPGDLLLLAKPRLTLPSGGRVRFVWSDGISSPSGVVGLQEQYFDFRVRPTFNARFSCERLNSDRACMPFGAMRVVFSAPVKSDLLRGARLISAEGGVVEPAAGEQEFINQVTFEGPFPPKTGFTVELPSGVTDDSGRELSNQDEFPLQVATDDYPPLAKFSGAFGILEAADPVLPVTVRNIEAELQMDRLKVEGPPVLAGAMMRVSPDDSEQVLSWLRLVQNRGWDDRGRSVFQLGILQPTRFTLPRPDGSEAFEVLGMELPGPGFFVVELESPILGGALLNPPGPMYVTTTALVTNLGVHLKWGIENSLVWVTSLDSSLPVQGAEIEIRDCDGSLLWKGKTDGSGIASTDKVPAPDKAAHCGWGRLESGILVTARKGDDFSFVHSDWNEGIEPWRYQLPVAYISSLVAVHTILDRTLVRAGDTLHMKHLLRKRSTNGFDRVEPGQRPETLVITHLGTWQEYTQKLQWEQEGIAVSEWEIPRDAKFGSYQIRLRDAEGRDWDSASFRVEEFRVPLMRASIQPPKEPLIQPKAVLLDVSAEYLSGGAARGLEAVLRYQEQPGSPQPVDRFEGYSFGDEPVEVGIQRARDSESPSNGYLRRAFELDEHGGKQLRIEGISPSSRFRNLLTELEFRDPNGEIQTVSSRVALWPSSKMAGVRVKEWMQSAEKLQFSVAVADPIGQPVPDWPVKVEVFERKNYSHRKRLVGGYYAYEHVREIVSDGILLEGSTNAEGILEYEGPAPASGNLIVMATAVDQQGRASVGTAQLWVRGDEGWWFDVEDNDRIDFIPEQKRYEAGQKARFQLRMPFREATALITVEREGVAEAFVTHVSGDQSIIEIPVKSSYAPNVFVSALVVRGRVGGAAPTAIVDLGKPAYKLGIGEIEVGYGTHALKVEVETDREVYQVREHARARVLVTDPGGNPLPSGAEVAVAVVDEGLLELAPNSTWDLLEAMMGRRSYGIRTATAQMHVVGKRHFGLKALPHGGGGGRQLTRELFDTLLLWEGRLSLDSNGEARIDVPLNDSITAFRVVALATAGLDRFGAGSTSIRTTRDVMIFSGLPPVVRDSDRFEAPFTFRNASSSPLNITVNISETESGLSIVRSVSLDPGDATDITVPAQVPVGLEKMNWTVSAAVGADVKDRLSVSQKVLPLVPVRAVQATMASLSSPFSMEVSRPADSIEGRGGISVELSRSLGGGLEGVRSYMRDYPFSCLEQELSRAVSLGERRTWDHWMQALPPYMDPDGLVRYFPSGAPGSEVLTAYLLVLADESGWPVPDDYRNLMLNGLDAFVAGRISLRHSPGADLTLRKLSAIEALSRFDRATPEMLSSMTIAPNLWPDPTVVDWYSILTRLEGIAERDSRLTEARRILRSRLTYRGTSAAFSEGSYRGLYWLMVSRDVSQARLILAVLNDSEWSEDLPKLVLGLMGQQSGGYWDLTTANALGSLAIGKYIGAFEAEAVSGRTGIELGQRRDTVDWSTGSTDDRRIGLPWPAANARLQIRHDGTGAPWAFVRATAAVPGVLPSNGFTVRHQIIPVEQSRGDQWSVGDIARIRLEVDTQADTAWVVVSDPIPPGALILGSGLDRDSALVVAGEAVPGGPAPSFEERSFGSYRAYYSFLTRGTSSFEYTIRLNAAGSFQLPPTRVEAMYQPEVSGELAAEDWIIRP